MLRPSIFGEDLFDDWFAFPDFRDLDRTERKLYGRHADRMMKTDVHEHDDDKKGKLIRQERYSGSMQRSFYVGENITEEDIKASFKHGVLNLTLPKKDKEKLPEKKQILIEG